MDRNTVIDFRQGECKCGFRFTINIRRRESTGQITREAVYSEDGHAIGNTNIQFCPHCSRQLRLYPDA